MEHISQCDACWEAFMNLGVDEQPSQREVTTAQKRKLFSQVNDPAYRGDHRMEQFQLLSSLDFTSYAKQVFLEYFTRLEELRPQARKAWQQALMRLEDALYEKLQKKKRESRDPGGPIDAEIMLGALDELGEPSSFLRSTAARLVAEPAFRRIYRSSEDKMLGGVCGGLGEYFRLDPILLRILFVGLLFVGGSSLFIYAILYLFLPVKAKPRPVFTRPEPSPEPAAEPEDSPEKPHYAGFGAFRKLLVGAITLGLFCCLYLPLLAALGVASMLCAFSIFHFPGSSDVFTAANIPGPLHLSQLGLPGVVAGGSLALLFFSLFLLVFTFACRLHFKKSFLGNSLQPIFVVFVVMSFFSSLVSAGMVFTGNREGAKKTVTRSFALPKGGLLSLEARHFAALKKSDISVGPVIVEGKQGATKLDVQVTLHTRGENHSEARRSLKQLVPAWEDKGSYFPTIQKRGGLFRFEYARVKLIVPASLSVQLDHLPYVVVVRGSFGEKLALKVGKKKLRLHQVKASHILVQGERSDIKAIGLRGKRIELRGRRATVVLRDLRAGRLQLKQQRSRVYLSDVKSELLDLRLERGSLDGRGISGVLDLRSQRSWVRLKMDGFTSRKNRIDIYRGSLRLYFPSKQIPQLNIHNHRGRIRDRKIRGLPTSKALLSGRLHRGKLRLKTWQPPLDLDTRSDKSSPRTPTRRAPTRARPAPTKGAAPGKVPARRAPARRGPAKSVPSLEEPKGQLKAQGSPSPRPTPSKASTGTPPSPRRAAKKPAPAPRPTALKKAAAPTPRPQPTSRPAAR